MILSNPSYPLIDLKAPGFSFDFEISLARAFFNTPLTRELFPEPETPVTATNLPKGISTLTDFKLFSLAPFKRIHPLSSVLRSVGTAIDFFPDKY